MPGGTLAGVSRAAVVTALRAGGFVAAEAEADADSVALDLWESYLEQVS